MSILLASLAYLLMFEGLLKCNLSLFCTYIDTTILLPSRLASAHLIVNASFHDLSLEYVFILLECVEEA